MAEIQRQDIVANGLSRLPSMWSNSPVLIKVLESYLVSLQEVEDILIELNTQRSIYTAVGAQLDVLGVLFNVPRSGRIDPTYREAILGEIIGAAASGTPSDVKNTARGITQATRVLIFEHFPASTYIFTNKLFSYTASKESQKSHAAGVRTRSSWFEGDNYFTPAWTRVDVDSGSELDVFLDISLLGDTAAVEDTLGDTHDLVIDTISVYGIEGYDGFTTLVPGATDYEVIDDKGRFCSTSPIEDATIEIGYIVDEFGNFIEDEEANLLQYVIFN